VTVVVVMVVMVVVVVVTGMGQRNYHPTLASH
jgi:hypothetical protein